MKFRQRLVRAVSAVALSTAAPATAGQVISSASASGRSLNESASDNGSTGPVVASINQGSGGSGSGVSAFAITDYGSNAAYAFSISSVPHDATNWGGFATVAGAESRWSDRLSVNTSVTGGFMNALLYVHASHALIPDPTASSSQSISASTKYDFFGSGQNQYSLLFQSSNITTSIAEFYQPGRATYVNGTVPSGQYISVIIPFRTNTFFTLESRLSCQARTTSGMLGSSNNAICDASNSAHWAGVLGMTDNLGNSINSWTITSESGTDYNRSFVPQNSVVPEPSTWAMLALGFGLIGGAIRSVKRRQKLTVCCAGPR
jgi:hypothetical protein